jgi:hypothetical protein
MHPALAPLLTGGQFSARQNAFLDPAEGLS